MSFLKGVRVSGLLRGTAVSAHAHCGVSEGHRLGFPTRVMEGLEYAPGFPRARLAHSLPVEEALQMAGALLLGGGRLWACLEGPPWGWGWALGRLGEKGEETIPGSPVATGMTHSLCGSCSGSVWGELGCVARLVYPSKGGRFICAFSRLPSGTLIIIP